MNVIAYREGNPPHAPLTQRPATYYIGLREPVPVQILWVEEVVGPLPTHSKPLGRLPAAPTRRVVAQDPERRSQTGSGIH